MGAEGSQPVAEGEPEPHKNYDKRTSRKQHRADFEAAIAQWNESQAPAGQDVESPPPPPALPASPRACGARGAPRKARSPSTSAARQKAALPSRDLVSKQLVTLKEKRRQARVRSASQDSQPPPPPPPGPPPPSPPSSSPTRPSWASWLADADEEEARVKEWFHGLCVRDAARAKRLVTHLRHIQQDTSSGQAPGVRRGSFDDASWFRADDEDAGRRGEGIVDQPAAGPGRTGRLLVYVRKRPMSPGERAEDFDVVKASGVGQGKSIVVFDTRMKADLRGMKLVANRFMFDHVFDEGVDNEQVFKETTAGLVSHAVRGGLATAFMFGQTGSGKTYTMSSLLQQAARRVFELLEAEDDVPVPATVAVSMFELYGTKCRDLLDPAATARQAAAESARAEEESASGTSDDPERKEEGDLGEIEGAAHVRMLEGSDGSLTFGGLTERLCVSEGALLEELERGQSARATSGTGVHAQSSRSHAFYRLEIHGSDGSRRGELLLVDLAGSERNKDSFLHCAKLRKEGAEINKSLMTLKNCFRAQALGQSFVPFRASMLTRVLKPALTDPEARTAIIATVSPSSGDTEHTLSTLHNVSVMFGGREAHTKSEPQEVRSLASIAADQAYKEAKLADPKRWTCERVQEWWRAHAPAALEPPARVSGAMLSKWSRARFEQYCRDAQRSRSENGEGGEGGPPSSPSSGAAAAAAATAMERAGVRLYHAFREELAKLRLRQQERAQAKRGVALHDGGAGTKSS